MASEAASLMLWLVLINSILKQPRLMDCPYLTILRLVVLSIFFSLNLLSSIATVSLVAYTGTLISFKI